MKRTMTALVALCAVVIGVTGCSGADEREVGKDDVVSTEPTTQAVEETPAGASVEQWASLVAEAKGGVVNAYEDWKDTDCLPGDTEVTCTINLSILSTTAHIFALQIDGGLKPEAEGYIGDPPADIAALVDQSREAAMGAKEALEIAHDACFDDENCLREGMTGIRSYEKLLAKIDAWSPYGVS